MTGPQFIITTTPRIDGARLSKRGEWGNVPFPSIEAAEREARRQGGCNATITRERGR